MTNRRLHVVHQLKGFNEICDPILSLMTDDELMKKMETMRDSRTLMNFLQDELGVRSSQYSLTGQVFLEGPVKLFKSMTHSFHLEVGVHVTQIHTKTSMLGNISDSEKKLWILIKQIIYAFILLMNICNLEV